MFATCSTGGDVPEGSTLVTRSSTLTGKQNSRVIPADEGAIRRYFSGEDGRVVQAQFPELSTEDREFLVTGATPEEWDAVFPPEEGVAA